MTSERREKLLSVLEKRQNNLTVVLENVFDPHNEAAVMRTCDSVGIQDVYIINNRIPLEKNGVSEVAAVQKNGLLFINILMFRSALEN